MLNYSKNLKSVDQIAKELGWSPKRVRTLIGEGLPVVKLGRQSLIYEDTLDQYLHEREAPRQAN
jgi:excisionase family DNA binding protein